MNISPDIIAIVLLFVVLIAVTYRYGKSHLTSFVLAFYPTYFLFDLLRPSVTSKSPYVLVGFFAFSFALMTYVLKRSILAGHSFTTPKRWIDSVLLSLAAISEIALLYYYILPISEIYDISKPVDALLGTTVPHLALAIIPFVALVITSRD